MIPSAAGTIWRCEPRPQELPLTSDPTAADLQSLILKQLDDDQAQDVVVIDLLGKSPLADAMIVASGR